MPFDLACYNQILEKDNTMDEELKNGGTLRPPGPQEQQAAAQQIINALDPAVSNIINTVIAGLVTLSGGAPPSIVLNMIAWKTGNLLASKVVADIAQQATVRKGFRDAFGDGISKAPMVHPQAVPPPSEA